MAARASVKACLAALLVSLASASSITGKAFSSWLLNTDCAAAIRLAGSGDSSVKPPSAASTVRRRRLLRRTAAAPSGSLSTAAPVEASMILPSAPVTKTFLVSGSAESRPSCSALMIEKASGLPEVATAPIASSVSEKSSLANLATASSNGPASAGRAKAAVKRIASRTARKRSRKLAVTIRPRQEFGGRAAVSPPSPLSWKRSLLKPLVASAGMDRDHDPSDQIGIRSPGRRTCWSWCCSCRTSCRPSRRSGPWSRRVPSTMRRRPPGPGSSTPRRTGRWL